MEQNEILEVIDCTPTWQALIQPMLDTFFALHTRNKKQNISIEQYCHLIDLQKEFKNMAIAADKWNEHCKNSK